MSTKYYRVKQDNFMWKEGAVLQSTGGGYTPVEDIWDATPVNDSEYISDRIIEHPDNAAYFERVYSNDLKGKGYKTADQMRELYKGAFKE